jgi:hypothetical protein
MTTITNVMIGIDGPYGRERVVYALPFGAHGNDRVPGFQYAAPKLFVDSYGNYLADPNGTIIGIDGLWIPRLLVARWTEDTRRLGG